MKLRLQLFFSIILFSLAACTSDGVEVGPQGPQGPKGPPGDDAVFGTVFEFEVDFTGPEYETFLDYPSDFTVYDSDKILVYLLWDVTEDGADVWRQLPQTILTDNGIYQYNFDFTSADVRLFLESEFDLDLLSSADTDNQIFRVLVVPAEFYEKARIDFSDYNAVAQMMGLQETTTDRSDFVGRE